MAKHTLLNFDGKTFDCVGKKVCVGKNCKKKIARVHCKLAAKPKAPRMPRRRVSEDVQDRAAMMELMARKAGTSMNQRGVAPAQGWKNWGLRGTRRGRR
jgi:hypothetical protein